MGIRNEAYETAKLIQLSFNSHGKQCYCSNIIFCLKMSVKLLPIYLRIYCIRVAHVLVIARHLTGVEVACSWQKVVMLRHCE